MAYDECHEQSLEVFEPPEAWLILLDRMLHFAGHEGIRVQKKCVKTCLQTEINPFTPIVGTWIFGWFVYFPTAGSFELWLGMKNRLIVIHAYSLLLRC